MKRSNDDDIHDVVDVNQNLIEMMDKFELGKHFLTLSGNLLEGIIGSKDFMNDTRSGFLWDPYEQSCGPGIAIDYVHWFWEAGFDAIEDPVTKCNIDEDPIDYIRRIRNTISIQTTESTVILPTISKVQLQELVDCFERFIDIVKLLTESKVALQQLIQGPVNTTVCGLRSFPNHEKKFKQ
jgi:hypothetical protein